MLVLSRKMGESVVVDLDLILTVTFMDEPEIEVSLSALNLRHIATFSLRCNETITLASGTRMAVIKFEEGRVRLGFEIPIDGRVDRAEA